MCGTAVIQPTASKDSTHLIEPFHGVLPTSFLMLSGFLAAAGAADVRRAWTASFAAKSAGKSWAEVMEVHGAAN